MEKQPIFGYLEKALAELDLVRSRMGKTAKIVQAPEQTKKQRGKTQKMAMAKYLEALAPKLYQYAGNNYR